MIVAEQLRKQYAGKVALDGLSFVAERGSVLGFIGPNGAGKTTTMRILCGIMQPSAGQVSVSGIDMLENPQKAKQQLGYLPENAPLHSGMTVLAFLKYCGRMRGLSGLRLDLAVEGAVEKCSLDSVLREETDALSKGFRRRVCLAQSIMHEPPNLVLDEPTDGLDPDQKREIRSLISRIREFSTIIVSTHILEEIDAVCDRVLAIRSGRKIFDGTTAEFRALAPDDGMLVLQFADFPDELLSEFEHLPGVGATVLQRNPDAVFLKLTPSKNSPCAFTMAPVLELAARHRLILRNCETRRGRLEDVFARLGRSSQENGRADE